jgi:hypothetical protein
LLGLRGWFRAGETRERISLVDAKADMEEMRQGPEMVSDRPKTQGPNR